MKMKLFLASVVCLMLCACDPDDETPKNPETSKTETGPTTPSTNKEKGDLVGTWKYSFDGENGYCIMTFKADGTGTNYEYDDGQEDNETFTYAYNKSTNELKVLWPSEKSSTGYVEEKYILKWIDNNSFQSDIADGGSIWNRQ